MRALRRFGADAPRRLSFWCLSIGAALLWIGLVPQAASAQVVEGRLVESPGDTPVASATVQLLEGGEGGESLVGGLTDEEGRFTLRAPATGTYRLRSERIGYRAVTTEPFDLVEGDAALQVTLAIAVAAVPLAPMVIVSDRPARLNPRLQVRGYYERKRTWGRRGMGFGHFLDSEELERTNPFRISDLLEALPGVRVEGIGGRAVMITLRPIASVGGGRCIPTVFVDGAPHADGVDINALVPIQEVVGVEVYPGLTGPGEFIRGQCGAIAVWTGSRDADVSIAELQEFAAENPSSISLEVRVGPGIGDFGPAASGFHLAPRFGGAATVDWRLFRRVSVYAGLSRTAFGCDQGFCRGREMSFLSRGAELGLRGDLEVPGRPWLQVGAVRHRLRVRWIEDGECREDISSSGLGVAIGGGVEIPIGTRFSLTPGVRFMRYATPDEVRLLAVGAGVRLTL